MNDNLPAYRNLVSARKSCSLCAGLTNPSRSAAGVYDGDEIGPWTRWEGDLDATVMVVGQDWGDEEGFKRQKGLDSSNSSTNRTLRELLASVGVRVDPPTGQTQRVGAFFTNAILCLKQGGAQAAVRAEWFAKCGQHFLRPQIELVHPKVVVCLGEQAYRAVLAAYGLSPSSFREAVDATEPTVLPDGIPVVAVYHCSQRILNTHRDLEAQRRDWRRVARVLGRQADVEASDA